MSHRILPIIRKEFIHIRRDFRTLIIIFALPIFMLFMFGYAINLELQHIALTVVDDNNSPDSRALIRAFSGSKHFNISVYDGKVSEVGSLFHQRAAMAVLLIPHDFAEELGAHQKTSVQLLIDGSDSNTAQLISNYANAVLQNFNADRGVTLPFDVSLAIEYNPALKSTYFFDPGLVALILMMISALLTSVAIAREKETGTMEQILVSPLRPAEIILGKVIPYIVMAFLDGLLILLVAHFWFEVPLRGSAWLMLGGALLYIFVALSLGLLISTLAQNQQVAMMVALIASMLPTLMLSGFIFPVNSMPFLLQLISKIVPATYFLKIIRGVMLKGNTFEHIRLMFAALAAMGLFFTFVSTKRFKMTL